MKSVGVMIGWNENLRTLGPPWQRLDIPGLQGMVQKSKRQFERLEENCHTGSS